MSTPQAGRSRLWRDHALSTDGVSNRSGDRGAESDLRRAVPGGFVRLVATQVMVSPSVTASLFDLIRGNDLGLDDELGRGRPEGDGPDRTSSSTQSLHIPPAVGAENLAGDEAGFFGGEVGDGVGDVLGSAFAADGSLLGYASAAVGGPGRGHRRGDKAGRDGVDRDAVWVDLVGQ